MEYYFWVNGYESAGVVKANNIKEAKEKVVKSQGCCGFVTPLNEEEFDEYDVATLVS